MRRLPRPAAGRASTRRVRLKGVFIADRCALWGHAVRRAISARGFGVRLEGDLEPARWRLAECRYDLTILSTSMGEEAMEVLLAELQAHHPSARVLVLLHPKGREPLEAWRFLPAATFVRPPRLVQDLADDVVEILGPALEAAEETA